MEDQSYWLQLKRNDISFFHPDHRSAFCAMCSLEKPTDYAAFKLKLDPSVFNYIPRIADLFFGYESSVDFQSITLRCQQTGIALGAFRKTQLSDGTFYYWFCENQTAIPAFACQALLHEFDPPLTETMSVNGVYAYIPLSECDRLVRAVHKGQLPFTYHDGKHEFTATVWGCAKREKTK